MKPINIADQAFGWRREDAYWRTPQTEKAWKMTHAIDKMRDLDVTSKQHSEASEAHLEAAGSIKEHSPAYYRHLLKAEEHKQSAEEASNREAQYSQWDEEDHPRDENGKFA